MTRTATTPTRSRTRRPRKGIEPEKPRWKQWLSVGFAVFYLVLCAAIVLDLDDAIATRTVPAADVAADLPGGSATCTDDLLAEVGATVECAVQDGPTTYRIRATVTTVDGDDVTWDYAEKNSADTP